jgi:hypothetical protein
MVKNQIPAKELADEIREAKKAGLKAEQTEPRAVAVRYDKKSKRIIVDLKTGISFMFPVELTEGLSEASEKDLSQVKVLADGFAIYFEPLDVVLSVPDLLMGIFGSKPWMSKIYSEMGRKGGKKTSPAKAKSSKANGRLGGRPKKSSAV